MTETTDTNPGVVLRRRPEGLLTWDDVELVEQPVPELADGEALMEALYLGMDATVRTWLNRGEGYLPAVEPGEVVRCSGIGRIVETRCDAYAIGDVAYGLPGWQRYGIVRDDVFTTRLPPGTDLASTISIYGATGATALFGMTEIGRIQPGETVVVSAAAGATGSIAGQVARIMGCRVVGVAGGPDKCRFVVDRLGYDACIDHRNDDVPARLKELCPKGVDVYFDNVGGPILDAVLGRLAMHGRVVLCGAISVYNERGRPPGPANYINLIARRGTMQGFIALDWVDRYPEASARLSEWVADGRLAHFEHWYDGLDSCVDALNALFTGANIGKVIVRLPGAPEPAS